MPCITKIIGLYGKNDNLPWKSSKFSLALQPEALVNTSGRVDFSSPEVDGQLGLLQILWRFNKDEQDEER